MLIPVWFCCSLHYVPLDISFAAFSLVFPHFMYRSFPLCAIGTYLATIHGAFIKNNLYIYIYIFGDPWRAIIFYWKGWGRGMRCVCVCVICVLCVCVCVCVYFHSPTSSIRCYSVSRDACMQPSRIWHRNFFGASRAILPSSLHRPT